MHRSLWTVYSFKGVTESKRLNPRFWKQLSWTKKIWGFDNQSLYWYHPGIDIPPNRIITAWNVLEKITKNEMPERTKIRRKNISKKYKININIFRSVAPLSFWICDRFWDLYCHSTTHTHTHTHNHNNHKNLLCLLCSQTIVHCTYCQIVR